ncbi:hypothetical protein K503DRAFT_784860 [Rhizopogon vinicolor AM-OR11-026]|uniref:DUF3074 domain-containing protein n=1 Tax=Rhizopogon vinicolor AM-OR11-026 TaxID=1314800 RepID=A0A1B7MSY1_9AGAM|nr:hypothetical protein K503DRAFT_784860 [Rhizopogon vinicolor AM-OR11-026]
MAFHEPLSQILSNTAHLNRVEQLAPVLLFEPDVQSIWTMYHTFPLLVSPRVFTVLQTIHLDKLSQRTGYDLLNPPLRLDLSGLGDEELANLEDKGTKGRYVSVEHLVELEDGKVEWQMEEVYRVSSRRAVWQAKLLLPFGVVVMWTAV